MAFSPSGDYLAIAYGASSLFKDALALYKSESTSISLLSYLKHHELHGTPKGICFSPDGTHLLVSFCEPSSIRIYRIDREQIDPTPSQIITGVESGLSRPEDVKMAPDGTFCAVSNSNSNTITYYLYDRCNNSIVSPEPIYTFHSPGLSFPHGIDFSFDGQYLGVTQFGSLSTTPEGDVVWPPGFSPSEGAIKIFRLH